MQTVTNSQCLLVFTTGIPGQTVSHLWRWNFEEDCRGGQHNSIGLTLAYAVTTKGLPIDV